MTAFTTTLGRYIAWRILKGVLMAFLIVTSIIMLVDFVETSRNIGADADLSPLTVMFLTMLKAPQLIEQTIPQLEQKIYEAGAPWIPGADLPQN